MIQRECASPIALTGYSALSKVLGHDVYVSNDQLSGTKIMPPNGITGTVVPDDVAGVRAQNVMGRRLKFCPVQEHECHILRLTRYTMASR